MSLVEKDEDQEIGYGPAVDSEADDDEGTQDWSMAAKLSKKTTTLSLPKRGEKDYEPDGTNVQELLLYKARMAMFDTLQNSARGSVLSNQIKAYYVPAFQEAVIPQPKGNFMQTMGKVDTHGKCWLQLHEFVYLAERGTITPYYCKYFPIIPGDENNDIEIPLSMQDLYSFFKSQQEMDRFFVYSHLKRLGYIVNLKGELQEERTSFYPPLIEPSIPLHLSQKVGGLVTFWEESKRSLLNSLFYCNWNFLIRRYTSSPQIYQGLNRLIPYVSPPKTIKELHYESFNSSIHLAEQSLQVSFDVWKPQTNFKKKSPGLPNFQVVVYNKNDSRQHFPTYSEFQGMFRSLDYKFEFLSEIEDDLAWNDHSYTKGKLRSDYLSSLKSKSVQVNASVKNKMTKSRKSKPSKMAPSNLQQINRLKSGFRSFLLAIMDDGLISFVKISEADFGSENVWYQASPHYKKGAKIQNKKKSTH